MTITPYRVEINYPKSGKPKYYLVKDVRLPKRKTKVRKYVGRKPPKKEEINRLRQKFAFDIELKAAQKKAETYSRYYRSNFLSVDEINQLEEIKYLYSTLLDLMTTSEIDAYERQFELHYIQGTTSIEGNTLTIKEANDLLLYDVMPKSKNLREINEVQNFRNVLKYRNNYRGKITLDFIKNLHSLIMANIDYESAGIFRRCDLIGITGCDLLPAASILIEKELQNIIDEYNAGLKNLRHPLELAILFHYQFETIHPFNDGNGRVGREILNYMLITNKFPKLLFLGKNRTMYLNALKMGDNDQYREMIRIFANLILEQRKTVFLQNLKNVVKSKKRTGQLQLTDFVAM